MLEQFLTFVIGIIGGIAVAIQTTIGNSIGGKLGGMASSFIVHFSGAFFSGLLLLLRGGENIRDIRVIPIWMYGAGLLGVILYWSIITTIPRIGVTTAVILITLGQLVASITVDHFGLFDVAVRQIDGNRILGVLLVLVGAYLVSR